jgi:hypothetical protein
VTRACWATLTVILVLQREGMVSLKPTLQYLVGTLLGLIPTMGRNAQTRRAQ